MTNFDKAEVEVDGEKYEEHLIKGFIVKAGVKHKVEVAWEGGKKKTYTLKLKEGESRVLLVVLLNTKRLRRKGNRAKNNNNKQPEKKGFLSVSSSPKGHVYMDGKR